MKTEKTRIKLEEGNYYPFKVSGSVDLPDGEECFVLTDVNGVKHLLYKSYYRNYNIRHGMDIRCRIDKINCTGKIFIEPEHPHYQPGKSYSFTFDSYREVRNSDGHLEKYAVLHNGLEQEIFLSADEIETDLNEGDLVNALVERIKKGRVHLSLSNHRNDYTGLETGKSYHFSVVGEHSTDPAYSFYVLKNDVGREFLLRKKFYAAYGIQPGDTLVCTLQETRHGLYLEPAHPRFEPGMSYTFPIVEELEIEAYPNRKKKAIRLENPFGRDILVKMEDVLTKNKTRKEIRCRVKAIKKGQVFLACDE
jgi:hypothetical protein